MGGRVAGVLPSGLEREPYVKNDTLLEYDRRYDRCHKSPVKGPSNCCKNSGLRLFSLAPWGGA